MAMLNNQRVSRPRPMARAKWLESSPWPFLNPPEPPEARHRKTPGNRKAMVWSNQRMIGRLPSWYPHSPHDFAQYVVSMFDQSKDGATIEEVAIQRGAADHLIFPLVHLVTQPDDKLGPPIFVYCIPSGKLT
jgi:hypothetical protein